MVLSSDVKASLHDSCPIMQMKELGGHYAKSALELLHQGTSRKENQKTSLEACVTKIELAEHLKVSISLINRLMAEDGLPHVKIGRAVRFRLDDIYAWFQRKGMKL